MRRVLMLIIFVLSTSIGFAQLAKQTEDTLKASNLHYVSDEIIWRKVYEIDKSKEEIRKLLKAQTLLDKVSLDDEGRLCGSFKNVRSLYSEYGLSLISVPNICANINMAGNVVIDIKDGSYRVTVFNQTIISANKHSEYGYNWTIYPYTYIINNKGAIKKNFIVALKVYDYTLDCYFRIKSFVDDDKW